MVRFPIRIFILGLLLGAFLAIILKVSQRKLRKSPFVEAPLKYHSFLNTEQIQHRWVPQDIVRYSNHNLLLESVFLRSKVNVLCVILVENWRNVRAIGDTWSKGCNSYQWVNLTRPKRVVPKLQDPWSKWGPLCRSLLDTSPEHDWVVVVYDRQFVLVENLRFFVATLDPNKGWYLGHAVRWGGVYNAGKAGYALSRGAIKALRTKSKEADVCNSKNSYRNREDFYLGSWLAKVNITPVDTRDDGGYATFNQFNLYQGLFGAPEYDRNAVFPGRCCSSRTITFQAIDGDKMYTYYYLLYSVQRFVGGELGNKRSLAHRWDDKIWKDFLKEHNFDTNSSSEEYYNLWTKIVDPATFAQRMALEDKNNVP